MLEWTEKLLLSIFNSKCLPLTNWEGLNRPLCASKMSEVNRKREGGKNPLNIINRSKTVDLGIFLLLLNGEGKLHNVPTEKATGSINFSALH